jgi:2-dehydropantoate 2-reductase
MTSGLSAVAGLTLVEVYRRDDTRRIAIPLGAEAFAVEEKLGFERQAVFGVPSDRWQVASGEKADAIREVMEVMFAQTVNMVDGGRSGTLQDLSKGRRTEVDYFNGYIADCGRAYGVATPVHAALATLIRRMERGEDHPDAMHLVKLR